MIVGSQVAYNDRIMCRMSQAHGVGAIGSRSCLPSHAEYGGAGRVGLMLRVIQTNVVLRMLDGGPARVWLGPAIRGMVGWAWKSRTCRHPSREWKLGRWKKCAGCPYLQECSYGRNVEPEYLPDSPRWHGQDRATPRIVITPVFPFEQTFEQGGILPLSITMMGANAEDDLADVLQSIAWAGSNRGLGNGGVPFEIVQVGDIRHTSLNPEDLPREVGPKAYLDQVRVELHTPLVLRDVTHPTLQNLFGAALRAVGQVLALHNLHIQADYPAMIAAVNEARLASHDFRTIEYERKSNRSGDRWASLAVIGWGIFDRVPVIALPWLTWGSILHLGQDRGVGNGAISITLGHQGVAGSCRHPLGLMTASAPRPR